MQAVIFDWGGTLSVWTNPDMEDMWRLAARHIAPDREEEMTSRLIAVEARSWERTRTDQRSTRLSDLLIQASDELGVDVIEAVLEEAATHHLDSWTPHIRHQPAAADTIAELRQSGLKIGLLSNTHWPGDFHEHFLERDGLDELIDARFYTSDMEYVKPHPEVFKAVLHGLDVTDPRQAVFVGDRLHDDIFGAQQAGMYGVWVANDHSGRPDPSSHGAVTPDAVIEHLEDLPGVIADLDAK